MAKDKYPSTAIPETEEDGGPVQDAEVEVVSGPVVKIERPTPLEPEPKPMYPKDETFGG